MTESCPAVFTRCADWRLDFVGVAILDLFQLKRKDQVIWPGCAGFNPIRVLENVRDCVMLHSPKDRPMVILATAHEDCGKNGTLEVLHQSIRLLRDGLSWADWGVPEPIIVGFWIYKVASDQGWDGWKMRLVTPLSDFLVALTVTQDDLQGEGLVFQRFVEAMKVIGEDVEEILPTLRQLVEAGRLVQSNGRWLYQDPYEA